jgi:hypothetical protein
MTGIQSWYEVLLAKKDGWTPRPEDIIPSNYEAADMWAPEIEFEKTHNVFDLFEFFGQEDLAGMRRNLRWYDILQMCVRRQKSSAVHAMIVVPAEQAARFASLSDRKPFADSRLPDQRIFTIRPGVFKTCYKGPVQAT